MFLRWDWALNVTVEGIAAAAKGKARTFGRLAGDAALGRLSDGHVKLRDFSGSKQDIAKRLGRKALSYGPGLQNSAWHSTPPHRCESVDKSWHQSCQSTVEEV
jgi:hypothetical protein